ncbi:hypothetical protein M407DRAFT_75730, partial [Tulasnella calospora MUT 4182]
VSTQFTAGIRTNGRVEAENRVNKGFGGPKVSGYQLFQRLMGRTEDQNQIEQIGVREYADTFAFHTCFKQMEKAVNYSIEVLHLPKGVASWALYGTQASDAAYVGSAWLMNKLCRLERAVKHVVKVGYRGTNTSSEHLLILLYHDRYLCDCCIGTNLGIPCSHFWATLQHGRGLNLAFNLGLIHPRYTLSVIQSFP